MIYTLMGKDMAKKGVQFIAQDSAECKKCKLYPTCIKNLEIGRRYVIKEIKDKSFKCTISDDVILVGVELSEIPLLVEKRKAIRGLTLKFTPLSNKKEELLNPHGLTPGDKITITKILEDHDGKMKKVLVEVV